MDYIAYEYEMQEMAERLKRHGYRGAICGPAGCGKSVMLHALGDELMEHGLSPLPLNLHPDRLEAFPTAWRRTIRKARHTDALLLDNYDLLPMWARAWVWAASMRAGAVVVTTHRESGFKTLAKPRPTAMLLKQILEQILQPTTHQMDYQSLFEKSDGNLRRAIDLACELVDESTRSAKLSKQAS